MSVKGSCRIIVLFLGVWLATGSAFGAAPSHTAVEALVPVDSAGSASSRSEQAEGGPEAPREGEYAPDFELPTMDGTNVVRLSQFRGARAVLLVFGSYT